MNDRKRLCQGLFMPSAADPSGLDTPFQLSSVYPSQGQDLCLSSLLLTSSSELIWGPEQKPC